MRRCEILIIYFILPADYDQITTLLLGRECMSASTPHPYALYIQSSSRKGNHMKRLKHSCKVALVCLFAVMSVLSVVSIPRVSYAAEAIDKVVLESNFDDDAIGQAPIGFEVSEGGGTVQVVDVPGAGSRSVYLHDTSEETNVILSQSFEPLTSEAAVELRFMMPEYGSATKVARIKGNGKQAVVIETKNDAITYRHGDDTYEPLVTVEENKWYVIRIEANVSADTASVYIDGVLAIENAPFYDAAADEIDFIESYTANSGTKSHYLDDVRIQGSSAPEESEASQAPVEQEEPAQEPVAEAGVYEAEDAVVLEGVIVDNKHAGFTGTGFTDYNPNAPGGYIEWTVEAPTAGEYTLEFRYAHGGTDPRPAEIQVNGEVIAAELTFDPTGAWTTWITTSTKATLQAGDNVIRATGVGASGGANIDYMKVYMEVDLIYEAEEAEITAAIIDNKHVGFTGTGFVDYNPNAPGGTITWKVDVPAEGVYTLAFRYAHGGTDPRPAEIKVNGEVAAAGLAFDPTGDWAGWMTTSTEASLKAGENTIVATAVGASGGGNIDHLRIHNKSEDTESTVELEVVELEELISGLERKKLEQIGLLADESIADVDGPVTRVEFMSLINDAMGFVHEDTFKGLGLETKVGEVSLDTWYAYALQAAMDVGYVHGYPDGTLKPEQTLSRQEAAVILAGLLNLTPNPNAAEGVRGLPDWSKGAIGAVVHSGYLDATGGGFSPQQALTRDEAREIARKLTAEQGQQASEARIVAAHAISRDTVAITLNSYFPEVNYEDLALSVPTGSWRTLTPGLQELPIAKAAAGVNSFGQTVIFLQSAESWSDNAVYIAEQADAKFTGDLAAAVELADHMISWQMDHGGFSKAIDYSKPWDGKSKRSEWQGPNGEDLGMIDNDATIKEIRHLATVYQETGEAKYKEAVLKGIDFLFTMQADTGGFPQVYPKRGEPSYSNYVTFNDHAMINVLDLMEDAVNRTYPFDGDLVAEELEEKLQASMDAGLDYILKSQVVVDGKRTGWGAQHDPITYEPRSARSYEHASLSGSEAVGIVRYLMARPDQTPEVKQAILAALQWFDEVKLEGIRYVSADPNGEYFVEDPNVDSWYRFYEIGTNEPIFSGRDGVIKRTIQEIEQERRDGYSWGGNYAQQLLETAKTTGYFEHKIYAAVSATQSQDASGQTLKEGDIRQVKNLSGQLAELPSRITVAQDGSGDYDTVQAAIDAVPQGNQDRVEIYIKNGSYKEVIRIPNDKPFLSLTGESATDTVITYDNYAGRDNGVGGTLGTSGSATAFLHANDLTLSGLTFENSFDESREVEGGKQAVAVNVRGDRIAFHNVRFLGNQDTLLTNGGTQYFYQCYIEGDVDFIFGGSRAVFEESVIHSLDRGSDSNNGYITAASTMITEPYGYLFLRSKLTSDAPAGTVFLGRPWHPSGNPDAIASVVFMHTEMGAHIKTEPWTDMSGFSWKDARFYEYRNTGPGATNNTSRAQLTDEEAANWTIDNVLGGWNPKAE